MVQPSDPATGGVVSYLPINGTPCTLHTFTTSGDFTVVSASPLAFNVALVGAGGGGGSYNALSTAGGGGGGAGGYIEGRTRFGGVPTGSIFRATVGAGGPVKTSGGTTYFTNSSSGLNMAVAGGGGGGGDYTTAPSGGQQGDGIPGDQPTDTTCVTCPGAGGGGAYGIAGYKGVGGTGIHSGGTAFETQYGKYGAGGGGYSADCQVNSSAGGQGLMILKLGYGQFICQGGFGSVPQAGVHFGDGGGGGNNSTTFLGQKGADGVVFVWYPTPTTTTIKLYMEPHQVRTQSGRNDTYKHPGRGLPSYQTEWMDALLFGN